LAVPVVALQTRPLLPIAHVAQHLVPLLRDQIEALHSDVAVLVLRTRTHTSE
jgi:hypothetical protein